MNFHSRPVRWTPEEKIRFDALVPGRKPKPRTVNRLMRRCRERFKEVLRDQIQLERTVALIGCSISELKLHLEKQWKPGMTWENYGIRGWHIDHVRPCSSFDLSDKTQRHKCFHFSNLQPLWARENLKKGSKWS